MPACSPIGTVFVSRPRKVGERANDGPPPDLLGADARSHGLAGGKHDPDTRRDDRRMQACQCRTAAATRHWHGAAATTLTGSLRRFVTGDPATAALGGNRSSIRAHRMVLPRAGFCLDCRRGRRNGPPHVARESSLGPVLRCLRRSREPHNGRLVMCSGTYQVLHDFAGPVAGKPEIDGVTYRVTVKAGDDAPKRRR